MANTRVAIIELFNAGKRQCEIVRLLKVPKQTVSDAIKRYRELGHIGDRPGRGRKRTVMTSANRNIIRQRVRRNPRVSMRKIARETGIARESVRKIATQQLRLKPYKLRKAQLLPEAAKKERLRRCRALLRRFAGDQWQKVVFTDEKLFTIEQVPNRQNDRIWSAEAPQARAIVTRRQNPQSVMVWGGVCGKGKLPLIFIDKGVKINQNVYRNDVLEAVVLPWVQQKFQNQNWTFQQDSAPAHRAKETQRWCSTHFPDFITAQEWPSYSPDLNPLDYSIWSILEARACAKPHKNLDDLKRSLLDQWNKISMDEVRSIVQDFKKRLKLCINAGGGHFENC